MQARLIGHKRPLADAYQSQSESEYPLAMSFAAIRLDLAVLKPLADLAAAGPAMSPGQPPLASSGGVNVRRRLKTRFPEARLTH